MRQLALIAFAACLVAGCHDGIAGIPAPPRDRLVCDEEPGRPVGSGAVYTDTRGVERREITDQDNNAYLQLLRATGQSCRDDVKWLRDWFEAQD